MIQYFLESPRPIKRLITLSFDGIAIPFCIAMSLMIDLGNEFAWRQQDFLVALFTLGGSILVFVRLGFYRAILRYIGITTVSVILLGVSASTLIYFVTYWSVHSSFSFSQALFYWCFLTLVVGGSRLGFKGYMERVHNSAAVVAIYGAGAAGRQLASALRYGDDYQPVIFFDDDSSLYHSEIEGLKVLSPLEIEEAIYKYKITHVLLAMPSTSHARRSEVLSHLEPFPIKVKTIAGMEDIISGKVSIGELKDIDVEDLLGRDAVCPDKELMAKNITDKVVMVTGAGGSIGSELCRQIILLGPKTLILYELSEYGLYAIEKELKALLKDSDIKLELVPLLGSIQHRNRLTRAMTSFKVQTVYHAAAYKHVPIVEHNIIEGVRNNVFGTWYTAEAAVEAGVEKFVLISTDKAVRPTNVMGATKRLAELVLQAMNLREGKTLFTMVRFGNVLGSSGSVVPLFREQIRSGGPVTVTHQDIIRYFMTIPEAAQLVIQAGAMGQGGDVFVLDMGEPVKIAALAEKMIHLMGRTIKSKRHPDGDIEIQFTGLRPGEKLYEELLIGENVEGTEHARIMRANEEMLAWDDMNNVLNILDELCVNMDCDGVVQMLLKTPTGYNPQHEVCDLLWKTDAARELSENNIVKFKTIS
nr:nucleoside-diphosphate sugar epimerase/dehydratase [Pleionea sp. CnH1-48]